MIGGREVVKKAPKKKKSPIKDAAKKDPLASLGFGIVAYVDMLWTLIWTFTLYTILLIPTMMYFAEGGAYSDVPAAVKSDYLDTYLGSMGYSSVQCVHVPTSIGKVALSCPYGSIGQFLDYGVNSQLGDSKNCLDSEANARCKPTNTQIGD